MKHDLFIDQYKVHFRDQSSKTGEYTNEIEANAFAAAILMPKSMLLQQINEHCLDITDDNDVKKLAEIFKVSSMAMTFRIANLNLF